MDTDMIANAHIGELWQHFNQFTSEQAFGMVYEHTPEYYDKFGSKFWKNVEAIGKLVSSLDEALAYQSGAIIFGATKQEHNHSCKKLLKRFAEKNVSFKPPKCTLSITEPGLLGFTVDAKSYRVDQNRFRPSINTKLPKVHRWVHAVLFQICPRFCYEGPAIISRPVILLMEMNRGI
ncbi:hypothetical protein EG68_09310 [Paragonimus skrjabini miyazakii]|uniref:Uncharacterized protein n=1 Tax=Paragonimus skrjabini miyazakii TaxID=59628 RepID=A0A8S9YN27_9TREM|nr:hypothetical protein EG68_09310 [Paragonimus skrjabini miyazakii]